jgi:putative membrane protein
MIATWLLGLLLVLLGGWGDSGWLWVKLAGVLGLTAFHGWCAARRRDFAAARNTRTGRTYRIMNEVPTLLLVLVVALVIVKPF